MVKVKLCYAPISQNDRGWGKTIDNLKKDKTCQHKIVAKPYTASNNTFTYIVQRYVPTTTYFVRAYVVNAANEEVAFGQSTDSHQAINLFKVQAISGRMSPSTLHRFASLLSRLYLCLDSSTWRRGKLSESPYYVTFLLDFIEQG
ncbi:nitrate transmembrane transporter [Perilla frutescens var. hirtella]|nr:nitrate transmembrane transporter [Perilla frutescens var. hirtella]